METLVQEYIYHSSINIDIRINENLSLLFHVINNII